MNRRPIPLLFILLLYGGILSAGLKDACAEENLALYPMKGYAYTYSPLAADGLHFQASLMYSLYQASNLKCRDGDIWAIPFGLTWGDGDLLEFTIASHYESWNNTDFDVDESGLGDLFVGGKVRLLGQDRNGVLDLSMMPYFLFPTGDRDKGIGDLFRYNPSEEDEIIYGLNLLIGKRWDRLYTGLNIGINYMGSDEPYVRNRSLLIGAFLEYQIREEMMAYLEFINSENRNTFTCEACTGCYDPDIDQDIREIGIGVSWLAGKWGLKFHVGGGLSKTSPDIRAFLTINRQLAYW